MPFSSRRFQNDSPLFSATDGELVSMNIDQNATGCGFVVSKGGLTYAVAACSDYRTLLCFNRK